MIKLPILIEEHQRSGLPLAFTEKWLDNKDLRQKLHMSQSTLRRHRLEGTISYIRINGKYYYRKSDIEMLMD
ncbi:MAG: helix-turn-helix domain-containing protein [Daejeonella sp.]|uniref:helix-turn-helix domain-containing protein n=1 Tax=Daejeonella sp. TaxID=2805397 RepID=UPI002735B8F0|nr:helix-turn-helix domain-containing protein [Daejeonella sp.]MDP3467563.1 helix-turn-helix domain-containing protein [Daejeonella sp.]